MSPRPTHNNDNNPFGIRDTFCVLDHPYDAGVRRSPLEPYPTSGELEDRIRVSRTPGVTENWDDLWLPDAIIAQSRRQVHAHLETDFPQWMRRMMGDFIGAESETVTARHAFQAARLFSLENRRVLDRASRRVDRLYDYRLQQEANLTRSVLLVHCHLCNH
jgi:hypothetical protein